MPRLSPEQTQTRLLAVYPHTEYLFSCLWTIGTIVEVYQRSPSLMQPP